MFLIFGNNFVAVAVMHESMLKWADKKIKEDQAAKGESTASQDVLTKEISKHEADKVKFEQERKKFAQEKTKFEIDKILSSKDEEQKKNDVLKLAVSKQNLIFGVDNLFKKRLENLEDWNVIVDMVSKYIEASGSDQLINILKKDKLNVVDLNKKLIEKINEIYAKNFSSIAKHRTSKASTTLNRVQMLNDTIDLDNLKKEIETLAQNVNKVKFLIKKSQKVNAKEVLYWFVLSLELLANKAIKDYEIELKKITSNK